MVFNGTLSSQNGTNPEGKIEKVRSYLLGIN